MTILLLELKKIFRPVPLLLALGLLCCFLPSAVKSQRKALSQMDTSAYPMQITVYDVTEGRCSIDLLFHDHLLGRYGKTISEKDLPELAAEREQLLDQITAAAAQDPILLRNRMSFDPDSEQFSVPYLEGENEDDISEADQIYLWSVTNGQARLPGTDHPIGFLSKYRTVLDRVRENGAYQVMSYDLFALLNGNFLIVIVCSCAALLLVVPYGVGEAKSRTEGLSAASKAGRAHGRKKLAAAVLAAGLVIGLGALLAALAIAQWGLSRYSGCEVGDAMDVCWGLAEYQGLPFGAFYLLRLLELVLLGLAVNTLAALLSLRIANSVTAIACALPLPLALLAFHVCYDMAYLEKPVHFGLRLEPCGIVVCLCLTSLLLTGVRIWRSRRRDVVPG